MKSKVCSTCKKIKNYTEFHKRSAAKDGHAYDCKDCVHEYDSDRQDMNRKHPKRILGDLIFCRYCEEYLPQSSFWSKNTYCKTCQPLLGHIGNLKRYGLTRDDYVDMEKSQNGVCKICGEPETTRNRLGVDHDHSCCVAGGSCGKCIRGLLCSRCNKVLGNIKDSTDLLQKMIKYLESNLTQNPKPPTTNL